MKLEIFFFILSFFHKIRTTQHTYVHDIFLTKLFRKKKIIQISKNGRK